jgi:hypothetical protein
MASVYSIVGDETVPYCDKIRAIYHEAPRMRISAVHSLFVQLGMHVGYEPGREQLHRVLARLQREQDAGHDALTGPDVRSLYNDLLPQYLQ